MLSCARHADWPPVIGAQGVLNYFGNGQINVLFSQSTRLIRIKFGMRKQGNEALSVCCLEALSLLLWPEATEEE